MERVSHTHTLNQTLRKCKKYTLKQARVLNTMLHKSQRVWVLFRYSDLLQLSHQYMEKYSYTFLSAFGLYFVEKATIFE